MIIIDVFFFFAPRQNRHSSPLKYIQIRHWLPSMGRPSIHAIPWARDESVGYGERAEGRCAIGSRQPAPVQRVGPHKFGHMSVRSALGESSYETHTKYVDEEKESISTLTGHGGARNLRGPKADTKSIVVSRCVLTRPCTPIESVHAKT